MLSFRFLDVRVEVTENDHTGFVFLKLLYVFAKFYMKQVSEKSKTTKQRVIMKTSILIFLVLSSNIMIIIFI
jgi:hypothetical protein